MGEGCGHAADSAVVVVGCGGEVMSALGGFYGAEVERGDGKDRMH